MCDCEYQLNEQKIIDNSLNAKNAYEKGYKYINDVPDLYKSFQDLLEVAEAKGYKLGNAKKKEGYFGLYSVIKEE